MSTGPSGAALAQPLAAPALPAGAGPFALLHPPALRRNLDRLRAACPAGTRVMAVVKSDAYGHGLENVVPALGDADGFAVATLEEAARVRRLRPRTVVLLLKGVLDAAELERAQALGLDLVVHAPWQIDLLAAAPRSRPLRVWLKVDTGMHRLGLAPDPAVRAAARLRTLRGVVPELVLMSHLASADDLEDPKTRLQLQRFREVAGRIAPRERSLANSAGALGWPGTSFEWVRAGIALYGASPLAGRSAPELGLEPALQLYSRLIAVNRCRRGDAIGYGGTWRCPEDMPVGVVGIGYGHGYPRHAPSGTPVLVDGRCCSLAGRVSMDMLTIDLRSAPGARVGDPVLLWGDGLPVEEVARHAGTIPYELLCGTRARVGVRLRADDA